MKTLLCSPHTLQPSHLYLYITPIFCVILSLPKGHKDASDGISSLKMDLEPYFSHCFGNCQLNPLCRVPPYRCSCGCSCGCCCCCYWCCCGPEWCCICGCFWLWVCWVPSWNTCTLVRPLIHSSPLFSCYGLPQTVLTLCVSMINTMYLADRLWWLPK